MESYGKLMEDFRRLWKVIECYGILWKVIECYGKLCPDKLHQQLQTTISDAQKWYHVSANKHQSPALDFKIGDKVFIKAEHFWTTHPLTKLSEKYLGPYDIIAQAGTHLFTLQLPNSLQSIHPVFHVSVLKPSTLNTIPNHIQPLSPLLNVDSKLEYEISKILSSKLDQWYKCKLQFYSNTYWRS